MPLNGCDVITALLAFGICLLVCMVLQNFLPEADVWKICVNVAVEPEAFLFRPNSEMSIIKHAIGSTVT